MLPLWFDGRIVDRDDARLAVLSDPTERPICCTTARVRGGRARHEAAHRVRLSRDSPRLGTGLIDEDAMSAAWAELAAAAFGDAEGIIRIEAHPRDGGELAHLVATAREVGHEPDTWTALRSPTAHPGPGPHRGAKLVHFPAYEEARAHASTFGVSETLLFNEIDQLVEGARSNIVVVRADGRAVTPDPNIGAVRGVGLSVVLDAAPEISPSTVSFDDLRSAREIIAINAVRGARAIVEFDKAAVGEGKVGPWATRLDAILSEVG